MLGVVDGLDPEPVASDEELALAGVPDREREHAVEAVEASRAPLLVGAKHDLRVGSGLEGAAALRELGCQFSEVVELAVVEITYLPSAELIG